MATKDESSLERKREALFEAAQKLADLDKKMEVAKRDLGAASDVLSRSLLTGTVNEFDLALAGKTPPNINAISREGVVNTNRLESLIHEWKEANLEKERLQKELGVTLTLSREERKPEHLRTLSSG